MSPTRQEKGPENMPAKTAIHVSYVAMTAAGSALAKNPVAAKNQRKIKKVILGSGICT
jgi:hypothetical protein